MKINGDTTICLKKIKMGRQSARDSRQFREYGIKGSVNMIKAIAENKAEIIEKAREQKNLIKIARKEAAQKKKKPQQQKERIKPQMEVEVIKEPRGAHDLGVIRRINTKKREVGKMSDIKRSKKSKTYHPPRWKYPYDSLPGSLRHIKDER